MRWRLEQSDASHKARTDASLSRHGRRYKAPFHGHPSPSLESTRQPPAVHEDNPGSCVTVKESQHEACRSRLLRIQHLRLENLETVVSSACFQNAVVIPSPCKRACPAVKISGSGAIRRTLVKRKADLESTKRGVI